MGQTSSVPVSWLAQVLFAVQWPVVVAAAFWLGRYVHELERRLCKAESNIDALVERHMPAIHSALSEIRGLLQSRR